MSRPSSDARLAQALLNAVAREPTPTAVHSFDAFFYPLVKRYVRQHHRVMGGYATALMGTGTVPGLRPDQVDDAAHITAVVALRRARASAARFDPTKGSAEAWVLRSAAMAFVEVAKQMAGIDREWRSEATEGDELQEHVDAHHATPDPADIVASRDEVERLFSTLTDDERRVMLLFGRYEFTYAAIASILFGDARHAKRVDHLLQQARAKMRHARSAQESDR